MKRLNFEDQILEIDKTDFVGVGTTKQLGMPNQYVITAYKSDNTEQILFSSFDIDLVKKALSDLKGRMQESKISNFAQVGFNFVNLDNLSNINVVAHSLNGQVFYVLKCKSKSGYNYDAYYGSMETADRLRFQLLKNCKEYVEQKFFE